MLKNAYLPLRSQAFPINTELMGNAIGGIGAYIGRGLGNSAYSTNNTQAMLTAQHLAMLQQSKYYPGPTAREVHFPGKLDIHGQCKRDVDVQGEYTHRSQSATCWLDAKIDRVRALGREWLGVGIVRRKPIVQSKLPPAVGGMREPLVDGAPTYTRRLKNGDEIRVYPKAEDWVQETMIGYNGI